MDNNIGKRIDELIKALVIKKVRFAERLKIDQSYVTQLTSGKRNPSERTVFDICREFNVREEWLRNSSGEMFLDLTEDEFTKAATMLSKDSFVRNLIIEYWKLDDSSRQLFRDFIHKLSDSMREQEQPAASEPAEPAMTVEEAESAYIKSRSVNAQKKALSVSNTTAGNAVNK